MKRRISLLLIFAVSTAVVFGVMTGSGQAFTAGSISVSGESWTASFIPSGNDNGEGADYFCVACYNADGTLNDIDIRNKPTSGALTFASGPCDSTWGTAVFPLSVVLTDPSTGPTGVSEESSAAAPYCGVSWNTQGGQPPDGGAGGGAGSPPAVPVPGCDVTIVLPTSAVGGTLVAPAEALFGPDPAMTTGITLESGKTAKVVGVDASGSYYRILWNCTYLWVPVASMGPTFDNVWNGAPLPTNVVQ